MCKRVFIILTLTFFVCTTCILILSQTESKKLITDKNNFEKYISFYKRNFDRLDIDINDRFVIKDEKGLSIGKNKNELENGYYDVKVIVKEKDIEIYINKLFKEFSSNRIYDEIYINEIVEVIFKLFDLEIERDELIKIIIDNYIRIRNINRVNVESVDKIINIGKIKISIIVHNNILVLKMGDAK